MGKLTRFVLIAVAAVVLLVVIVAVSLPLFLNADSFRTRIETTLTTSLGRKVTIGKVELSVWSGGLVAENVSIADDPHFSSQPFLEAQSIKIRVELLPLVLHREIHIQGFALQSPKIQLLRGANAAGKQTWNYSSISSGGSKSAAQPAAPATTPNLTAGHVEVTDGQITVGEQAGPGSTGAEQNRVYQQVSLDVKNFGFTNSFPFTASAHLPGDGTVSLNGTAGPINQQDASETPFQGHLELKHIDPLAAGLVEPSDGLSGLVEDVVLDAAWSGQQLHVTRLLVDSPHLNLVQTSTPKTPAPATAAGPKKPSVFETLSVDDAEIKNGAITMTTAGKAGAPVVYQQINAQVTNLTPTSVSPFKVSAQLPGGGGLTANGQAGPFNQQSNASTPVNANVSLSHVQLATAGVLPPDAGISGVMDLQAQVRSNGQMLNAAGKAQVVNIKLAKNGTPSAKPVNAQFTIAQNELAKTGQIQSATVSVGRAVVGLGGTYQSSGPTTALNLKVNGNAMPIDEIEAFLPAVGVRLPQGSRLQGGTLTTALTVSGSSASPVITGPVRIDNTQLSGFNLGAKLQTLSKLTGGRITSATGNGTNVRSLSMDVRDTTAGIETDKIALDVAGLGTATGNGSVSEAGALRYSMLLKLTGLTMGGAAPAAGSQPAPSGGSSGLAGGLAGLLGGGAGGGSSNALLGSLAASAMKRGIPVEIAGTTSNPTFAPNLAGLATGVGASAAQQVLQGQGKGAPSAGKPADQLKKSLGGFLGH